LLARTVNELAYVVQGVTGTSEWAAGFAPDLLGLTPDQLQGLNDDRVGRSLARLFRAGFRSLTLADCQECR